MTWATVFLFFFVAFLVCLYFMPYRVLKGKIFKKLFQDTSNITNITYEGKDFKVSFERRGRLWFMTSPDSWQADTAKMRRLLLKISELNVDSRKLGKNPKDDEFDIGRNGVLGLTIGESLVTLDLGCFVEQSEQIYITKSDDKDILLVSGSILFVLPKSVADFKRMLLFEEVYGSISSVEASLDGRGYLMSRTEVGWIVNGKNAFDEKVQPFVEGILGVVADSIAPKEIKLPPKHYGSLAIRTSGRKSASRYFFKSPDYEGSYLVPMDGEVLVISAVAVEKCFEF